MKKWRPVDDELADVYTVFWRFMQLSVSRYGSFPTGHLFMVITVMLLDLVDYYPTVGELATITQLPKSTVSRYVSVEMKAGFLEEVIDPGDRRRRRLHVTEKGKEEQDWHQEHIRRVADLSAQAFRGEGATEDPAADLKQLMLNHQLRG